MANSETIVSYFDKLGLAHHELGPEMWMVTDASGTVSNIVVHLDAPLVVFRVKVMDLPEGEHSALFRLMLELNASEMVHGAYGLEGNAIVIVDTLQSETLDEQELQGSVDALALAVNTHIPRLARLLA